MNSTLILHCDCGMNVCKTELEISPINTISINDNNKHIGGLHLSIEDTKKLISKLQENLLIMEDNRKELQLITAQLIARRMSKN